MSFSEKYNYKTFEDKSHKQNCLNKEIQYVTSYGIIAFIQNYDKEYSFKTQKILNYNGKPPPGFEDKIKDKVLLIQRRNTMGYNDFIRGRYFNQNIEKMTKIYLSEMTQYERSKIKNLSFEELWDDLWYSHAGFIYEIDKQKSKEKFEKLNIQKLLEETNSEYLHTEFSFPKGRKHKKETDLECAMREFEEETGLSSEFYKILNIEPIVEIFKGTNNIHYKHIYYIADIYKDKIDFDIKVNILNLKQCEEVSNIDFIIIKDCFRLFRKYDSEKKKILEYAYNIYKEYMKEI